MNRTRQTLFGLVGLLTVLLGAAAGPLTAQTRIPAVPAGVLADEAKLLTDAEQEKVADAFRELKASSGIAIVALTVEALSDWGASTKDLDAFVRDVFNAWKVGDREKNDGILIFVSKLDRKVRVELGAGYPVAANAKARSVIDRTMSPAFKRGAWASGMIDGAKALVRDLGASANGASGGGRAGDPVSPLTDGAPVIRGPDRSTSPRDLDPSRANGRPGITLSRGTSFGPVVIMLIVFCVILALILFMILARQSASAWRMLRASDPLHGGSPASSQQTGDAGSFMAGMIAQDLATKMMHGAHPAPPFVDMQTPSSDAMPTSAPTVDHSPPPSSFDASSFGGGHSSGGGASGGF